MQDKWKNINAEKAKQINQNWDLPWLTRVIRDEILKRVCVSLEIVINDSKKNSK